MKFSIKLKLILSFSLLLGFLLCTTVIGINQVSLIDKQMTIINDTNSVKQRYAINFRGSVHDRAIAIRDVVLSIEQSDINEAIKNIATLELFYIESSGPLEKLMITSSTVEEQQILEKIKNIEKKTLPLVKTIVSDIASGKKAQAKLLLINKAKPAFTEWLAAINKFIDHQEDKNKIETLKVREITNDFASFMLTITGVALIVSVIIVILIISNLFSSLGGEPYYIAELLKRMADGELTLNIQKPKPNSVLSSLVRLQKQLFHTIEGINTSAKEINSQKTSKSQDSNKLLNLSKLQNTHSENASINLSSVQDEAVMISERLSNTKTNSKESLDSSTDGVKAVSKSSSEISNVYSIINSAVANIKELERSTQEISSITGTISAISDQTNLLALNAAIEAARAGESGRGFAVVADEVRSLAQRTTVATSEIEEMLSKVKDETNATMTIMDSSLPKIERCLTLSNESTEILNIIESKAKESLINVNEVISASGSQIKSIDHLRESMTNVVSSSEDISSVSNEFYTESEKLNEELSETAKRLLNHSEYFKV